MPAGPRDKEEIRARLEGLIVEAGREGARTAKRLLVVHAIRGVELTDEQRREIRSNIRSWVAEGSLADHLDLDDLVRSLEAELASLRRTILDRGDPSTPALVVERMGTVGWRVAVNPRAVQRLAEAVRDGWSR